MCTSVCRAGFANYDSPKIGTTGTRARATTTSALLPLDNELFEDTPLAHTDTALRTNQDVAVPMKSCSHEGFYWNTTFSLQENLIILLLYK